MVSNMTTLFITLQFLESARRDMCKKNMDNYLKCVKNKRNTYQDCHILHMEKFNNCIKSLEIIKKMNKNDS